MKFCLFVAVFDRLSFDPSSFKPMSSDPMAFDLRSFDPVSVNQKNNDAALQPRCPFFSVFPKSLDDPPPSIE